jgi:hypothetical protein
MKRYRDKMKTDTDKYEQKKKRDKERGVLDTTLCDKVLSVTCRGLWFYPGTLVSSTNKTDCHDITEILLKVVFNTINQPTNHTGNCRFFRSDFIFK